MSRRTTHVLVALSLWASACGGANQSGADEATEKKLAVARKTGRAKPLVGADRPADDEKRCAEGRDREISEYDTSGDELPDVRKVFLQMGEAPSTHLVLICREADLNGDGIKDVIRYYSDEGSPVRQEADRNFDGQMDEISFFQGGRTIRQELDRNGDGKVDAKLFFERGTPVRGERDLAGRSTATQWKADRWEYYENGRLVRMGTDVDGDSKVDRWDRNEELRERFERERLEREQAAEASTGEGEGEGEEGIDDSEPEAEGS